MNKLYKVRGLLKRGSKADRFSVLVEASSVKSANQIVKDIVSGYCKYNYPDKSEVQCIINKKTVRY